MIRALLLSLLVGFSLQAHAGLMIEPYLGYERTASKLTLTTAYGASLGTPDFNGTMTGSSYGLRLGYKFTMFWAALDYSGGASKNDVYYSGQQDQDITRSSLGAAVGIDIPFLIRFWVGQNFQDEYTAKARNAANTLDLSDKYKGTSTKLGVGLNFLPIVSINFEYIMRKYTSGSGDSFTGATTYDNSVTANDHSSVLASISVPFNL